MLLSAPITLAIARYFPVDASYLTVIFVCPPGIVIYDALRVPLYGISVLPSGLSFESSP